MNLYNDASLQGLATDLRCGKLALHTYLDTLEANFIRREPQIQAFVPEEARFKRLHLQADSLLTNFPDWQTRPPLFGVPVGIKDIFHVSGLSTRAGSRLPHKILHAAEAAAVTVLKSAGALILGKTVTTEFAYFAPGPTRNPHNLDHTPGGSSSGSAAAIAAGLSPLTLGTQTIGSVNRPAAFCGVVGFKPSYDRISRQGVIPLSPSADHVGLFVPQVADCAFVAPLLCKEWQKTDNLKKAVLGVPEGPYLSHLSAEGRHHFDTIRRRLEDGGFEIKTVSVMSDFSEIVDRHQLIVAADAARVHQIWFAKYGSLYHEKTANLIKTGQKISDKVLEKARQGQLTLRQELSQAMQENEIDLWVTPSAVGPAPKGIESTGDPIMNLPWTHAGFPTLSIPGAKSKMGLPLGLQLVGSWYGDEKLIDWGISVADIVSL